MYELKRLRVSRYLFDQRQIAANICKYGTIIQYSTITSNSDINVISAHHVKNIVHMIDSMRSICPCIGTNRDGLK